MNQNPLPQAEAQNPVFSIAGATPGANQAAWKTAYPNPDNLVAEPRPVGHGPTLTSVSYTHLTLPTTERV